MNAPTHPLIHGHPPDWADTWGQDEHGPWVGFTIDEVTQRMRWIPPGKFLMGSPSTEEGRNDREGPRHEVTISQGYWLFNTPCTQALWQVVMGENPSHFKGPLRPVEQVSWEDVQSFLEKINERIVGLDLVLPTEAQWEYACRAGTVTTTYAGNLEILGENNAPLLDAIAWYGGNSGHEYNLDTIVNSSEWLNKQYPHVNAGTRKVAQKQANPWGLYDMLGNVLEWCQDGMRKYSENSEIDPVGPINRVASRTVHGGSWIDYARVLRASYRRAFESDEHYYSIGFRAARVQT